MHELLERQIALYLGGDRNRLPADFLEAVDRSYRQAEAAGRLRPDPPRSGAGPAFPSNGDASAALLRATLEATADGILVVDRDGAIAGYNQLFLDMWGLTAEDLADGGARSLERARELVVDADSFVEMLRRLHGDIRTQERDLVELRDGRMLERCSIPQWVGRECVGRVWSFRDVTEHHRLEAQIRQSQKMEAVGRVAGGIAHDFNNLLTVIKGYCDLCERQMEDDAGPVAKSLRQISKAAAQAAQMTGHLLSFSRQQEVEPSILDLHAVVRDFQPMMRRLIDEDVAFEVKLEASSALVLIDRARLQQVLLNLVINARDALDRGGRIRVTTDDLFLVPGPGSPFGEDLHAGRYLVLEVNDDGKGMAEEVRSQIFEPFFTTKGKGGGTGLGLATVYGIVKQSGGAIIVESEVGRGTTFSLALPLEKEHGEPAHGEAAEAPSPKRRAKILVVEDEEPVRLMLEALLEEQGHEVLMAEGPEQAAALFEESGSRVELLVTDIVMPGMYGPELARQLKAQRPDLAVLYISGYDPEARERRGAPRPGGAFLQKPFDARSLDRKIQETLEAAGAGEENAAAPGDAPNHGPPPGDAAGDGAAAEPLTAGTAGAEVSRR